MPRRKNMSEEIEYKAKPAKAVRYQLAKGGRLCLNDCELKEITDADLEKEPVLALLSKYETRTGRKVFGVHVVAK